MWGFLAGSVARYRQIKVVSKDGLTIKPRHYELIQLRIREKYKKTAEDVSAARSAWGVVRGDRYSWERGLGMVTSSDQFRCSCRIGKFSKNMGFQQSR